MGDHDTFARETHRRDVQNKPFVAWHACCCARSTVMLARCLRRHRGELFAWIALCALGCLSERKDCDHALDVICACSSRPCDRSPPPSIVTALRRCDDDDVRPSDQDGNVHLCVQMVGSAICGVLDGLAANDGSICKASCELDTATCSVPLEQECQRAQYETCDIPDAGVTEAGMREAR
jgi:hypothetical protein